MSTLRTVGHQASARPHKVFPLRPLPHPLTVPFGTPVAYALTAWVASTSLVAFLVMAFDKRRSKTLKRRVRERTLLFHAWIGGGPGSWLAMHYVRHKTRHLRFRILVPLTAVAWLAVVTYAWLG